MRNVAVTDSRIINDELAVRNFAERGFQSGNVTRVFGTLFFGKFTILIPEFVGSGDSVRSESLFIFVYEFAFERGIYVILEIVKLKN